MNRRKFARNLCLIFEDVLYVKTEFSNITNDPSSLRTLGHCMEVIVLLLMESTFIIRRAIFGESIVSRVGWAHGRVGFAHAG